MAKKKVSPLMITKQSHYHSQPRFASIDFQYYLHMTLRFTVIGSCNGIICLFDNIRCYLWNPSTMQSKELPKYPNFSPTVMNLRYEVKLAFGFDSISNDYKVLRFICPAKTTSTVVPLVQLYSTNTGSWKEIKVHDESPSRVLCCPKLKLGPVINGVLYIGNVGQLVSFDLHTEVFAVVLFPSSKFIKSDVLDYEDSVAVILQSKRNRSRISLWTLADSHGELFWMKKFNIVRDNIGRINSYVGGGLLYGKKRNILYDYVNNKFKSFPPLAQKPEAVLKYTETLASIEGFEPSVSLMSKFYPQLN